MLLSFQNRAWQFKDDHTNDKFVKQQQQIAAESLLWLAMIFPTLEFLISRCEHQFDVHQSPPAKVHRHTAIETHPVPAL